jgi:PhzF family phenazine biosynthesis protein
MIASTQRRALGSRVDIHLTMTGGVDVLRYTAFTHDPSGGNPAGVVLDAGDIDDAAMLAVAAEVGYSETAFLWPLADEGEYRVRYFSPAAEVPFCGHATIASAVALADHGATGELRFHTQSGEVNVIVGVDEGRRPRATLTSVKPSVRLVPDAVVAEALAALGWDEDDVDPELPPRSAFAGAHHLVVGVRSRQLLAAMSYDFAAMRSLMEREGWTTAQLVWRENPDIFHARVPFPVGGVVEDPATGAAAAALGAYLRELGRVQPPARITIHQGDDLGRPSLIVVDIEPGDGGIRVSGNAVPLTP